MGVFITAWTAMRSPSVQTATVKKILKNISKEIGAEITIGRIRYGINKTLIIRHLYIKDQQKDTLLYIRRLETSINDIDFNSKKVSLDNLVLTEIYSSIYQINDSSFNFDFILKKLKFDTQKKFNWLITCKKISITNSTVNYNEQNREGHYLNNISLNISNIYIDSTKQELTITHFETDIDKKSFINNLTGFVNKKQSKIKIHNFNILAANSHINFEFAILNLPSKTNNSSTNSTYNKAFNYRTKIGSSKINLNDLSVIFPKLNNNTDEISISGILKGNKTKIQGKSIKLNTGKESSLLCDFNIMDFMDKKNMNYNFNIKSLFTNKTDITHILNNYFNSDTTIIPNQLSILEDITYTGVVNGNYNNFYNKGKVLSRLGQIKLNLTIKNNEKNDSIWLEGNVKAMPLYLDLLVNNSTIGEIEFNINTKGFYSKSNGPDFEITGNVNHFNFNNYSLDSVGITGNISENKFVGRVSSFDPNIRFDFDGALNFDTIPSYDFLFNLYYANLYELGIRKKDTSANLSLVIKADFIGNHIDNTTGEIQISDIFYFTDSSYFATDSILITSNPIKAGKELNFYSEYLQANIKGDYNSLTLIRSLKTLTNHYLPSLGIAPSKPEIKNNFSFKIVANYPHPVTELIAPNFRISPGSTIYGNFNGKKQKINLSLKSDKIEFFKQNLTNVNLKAFTQKDKITINLISNEFKYNKKNSLKNFYISTIFFNDSIKANFNWNNWLDENYSGNLNTLFTLSRGKNKYEPNIKLDIFPGNINVLDTIWFLSQGYIKKDSAGYTFHNIKIDNGTSKFEVSGIISDNPKDSIALNAENINLEHLNNILKNDKLIFGGKLTGNTLIKDIKGEREINSNLQIEKLTLNGKLIGNTKLNTKWDENDKELYVSSSSINNNIETFAFDGYISPNKKTINIDTRFKQQPLEILAPFLEPTFDKIKGNIDGKIKVFGNLINPSWKGSLKVSKAKLLVTPTNVNYNFNDSVYFSNHDILFNNINAYDADNNQAIINGRIWHKSFRDFFFDIKIETDKILAINLKSTDNPYYYGKLYGSGYVDIKGPSSTIDINIAAKTKDYSFIHIPLEGKGDIEDNDFIEFTSPYNFITPKNNYSKKITKIIESKAITNLRIDLDVTPDVEVQIVFDPLIGDVLRANGFAHLAIESLGDKFNMYGDYTITKGDFMFTLQNVINKRLLIQQGSTVSFNGNPLNANINMDAIYKVRKASVYDLTLDETDKEKRVEVNTHLLMTGKLVKPTIKFAVDVPSATNDEAIDQINSLPEEDLNKQVLSLLLVNKFTALTTYRTGITEGATGNMGATTASELLSNQLSNWMSQISNDFDLGFVYRPGNENTQQEYEVAVSTNLFNDRIILNGNFGYSENMREQNNTPLTGDGSIEYKITKKGNLRLRAFQKVNNDITYNQAPYTQGFGIFYTEDFNNFNELLQKMFRRENATKPKKVKIKTDDIEISN